jgi:hypothetical protein
MGYTRRRNVVGVESLMSVDDMSEIRSPRVALARPQQPHIPRLHVLLALLGIIRVFNLYMQVNNSNDLPTPISCQLV